MSSAIGQIMCIRTMCTIIRPSTAASRTAVRRPKLPPHSDRSNRVAIRPSVYLNRTHQRKASPVRSSNCPNEPACWVAVSDARTANSINPSEFNYKPYTNTNLISFVIRHRVSTADGVIRKESSKETDDEGFQQLVAHQTSNQTIASKSSSNDEQQSSAKRPLVPRTATIETQLTTGGLPSESASAPIKRNVSLDSAAAGKQLALTSSADSNAEASKPTGSSTGGKLKQMDSSTVLTVSNLIAAHGTVTDCMNNNKLIRTTGQPSKTSLSSLNSNASTSSESTILILQNTDLINEKAFVIQSGGQAKPKGDQPEPESKSDDQKRK